MGSSPTLTITGTGFGPVPNAAFATTSLNTANWTTTYVSDTQLTVVKIGGTPVVGTEDAWVEMDDGTVFSNHLPFTWT